MPWPQWLAPLVDPIACLPPMPEATAENADALLARLEKALKLKNRSAMSGEKSSVLRGHGLDFAELREYVPGDEVRKIDWNVFARTLSPHIKEYRDEKLLTLWLAVDLTPSMGFGHTLTKAQRAVEWAGLVGLMAAKARHRLGLVLITAERTDILPPQGGQAQLRHLTQRLLAAEAGLRRPAAPADLPPDHLAKGLERLAHVSGRRGTLFLFSDFTAPIESWRPVLGELFGKADLTSVLIADTSEQRWPEGLGRLPVFDPESGETAWIDGRDAQLKAAYKAAMAERQAESMQVLQNLGTALAADTAWEPPAFLEQLTTAMQRKGL